jgi:hypothetical protein
MAYYYNQLPNYSGSSGGTGDSSVPNPASDYDNSPKARGIAPKVFGGNPGTVGLPNMYGQMTNIVPTLPSTNLQLGQNVDDAAKGRLTSEELASMRDSLAGNAQDWGMPGTMSGSELGTNLAARSAGMATRQIQQGAFPNYNSLFPTIAKTQMVDAESQLMNAMFNATNAAKEDPGIGAIMGGAGSGGGGM